MLCYNNTELVSGFILSSYWKIFSDFSVSFAGSVTVLVMLQLIAALAVTNLVARVDEPPLWMVRPFEGTLGKIMCLNNIPLFGQVKNLLQMVKGYFKPYTAIKLCVSILTNHPNYHYFT